MKTCRQADGQTHKQKDRRASTDTERWTETRRDSERDTDKGKADEREK